MKSIGEICEQQNIRYGSALMIGITKKKSFEETRGKKDQKQPMTVEYDAMMKNQTWELMSCPK